MNCSTLLCTINKTHKMNESILSSLFLLPIAAFLMTAVISAKNKHFNLLKRLTQVTPILAVAISLFGAYWVFANGVTESGLLGIFDLGFSIRLDALSLTMFAMVSIIAIVVLRFSYNYLDGDANQGKFISGLAITIAFVQLLVLSGNIFGLFVTWVATSLALKNMIVFYPERKKARVAARKKFIVARLGDLSLLIALTLIFIHFGSGNLSSIFESLQSSTDGSISFSLEIVTMLLVLTAGLKSSQIPFHSWLIEVMEAPTPVSALLHAGLLNAGPFLMIRFAYLLDAVTIAPILLFLMGAVTAIYGAVVFTTQPNIKTALAYSSVGHMGFTLMVCGLGVYSASLLHLVAHSFYKAHSFLSSGSMIDKVQTKSASNFTRKGSALNMFAGFILAIALFIGVASIWGIGFDSEFQLLIIGGVILTGTMSLVVNALDSNNFIGSILKILGATVVVLMAFFGLEELVRIMLGNEIPAIPHPSTLLVISSSIILMFFFLLILGQLIAPFLKKNSAYQSLGVHVRNGFYLNIVVDRLTKTINHKMH
jgi:NAD(P)H-quinone oxidoreductase subunit 5